MSKGLLDKPQPEFLRTSSLRHIPRKCDSEAASSATFPRASNPPASLPNGNQRTSGNSVHFILTSTPVKARANLQLHQSADELGPTQAYREASVDRPSAGVSDPQLSRSLPPAEQFPGEESCVALSGVAVESDLILSPLTTSQVAVSSSARASSDMSEVFDEIPREEAKPQLSARPQEEEELEEPEAEEAPLTSPEDAEEDSGPVPIWKAVAVVAFVLFILSLLGSILVFEGEMHSTALNAFRSSPAVEGVFHNVYRPLRRGVVG